MFSVKAGGGGVGTFFLDFLAFLVCCSTDFLLSDGMGHMGVNSLRFKSYKPWRETNFSQKSKSFIIS